MDIAQAFSSDYTVARERFRESARAARCELSSFPIGQLGPHGRELTIDVAVRGPETASRALVVSSGMHGIEGYFGSAVQLSWLTSELAQRAATHKLVLIHALNPYGFAWRRRVNEGNVDLNRNFMRAGQPFAGAHPAYRELDPLLNPSTRPERLDPFLLKAGLAAAKQGFKVLKNAVAQGQYDFPRGLFFGGQAPARSQRILAEQLPRVLGRPEHVIHLDLHTGSGPYGTYALCAELPSGGERYLGLTQLFGRGAIQAFDPSGVLYEIRGALGPWLEEQFPATRYDCLLAEFGTYHAFRVLSALRRENRATHYASDDEQLLERARDQLFEMFCPRSLEWRLGSVQEALRVITQASSALG